MHQRLLCSLLGLKRGDKVVIEFQKKKYGRSGDVDIAAWINPNTEDERIIGVEVKSLFLNADGVFKSEKLLKHNKQLNALEKEGWDAVYFFDFIVSSPANGWLHPQVFEGYENYRKVVESMNHGHVVFFISSVAGKPESVAGGISHEVLQEAMPLSQKPDRIKILEALKKIDFSSSPIVVDSV